MRNPAFAQMIEAWFDEIRLLAGPVKFEDTDTATVLSQNSEQYNLKLAAPSLADREILLIAGWDDSTVSIESHILPLYRALVAANAQKVQIIAFQDNHIFENSREQLAQTVAKWILTR